ncbi:hypothetical protein OIE68_00615 [Nocardia vinacea]|uniref:hypothetical protein n=1 Tax=Nocardia vinacea TaxID=96468 RepID=UPI002E130087|nr:hypothetical protein OIE68_00615 [Nocardia vinacea]
MQSLHAFLAADGYMLTDLRADLNRFVTVVQNITIPRKTFTRHRSDTPDDRTRRPA